MIIHDKSPTARGTQDQHYPANRLNATCFAPYSGGSRASLPCGCSPNRLHRHACHHSSTCQPSQLSSLSVQRSCHGLHHLNMRFEAATTTFACGEGQKLMNRASTPLRTTHVGGTEDCCFRSSFVTGVKTVLNVWIRMRRGGSVPDQGGFNHLLWALMFMKVYPDSENEACTLMGASILTRRGSGSGLSSRVLLESATTW